jgi:hypothetical protein
MKGDEMKKRTTFLSQKRGVYYLLSPLFLPVIFLSLLMFPAAAFCDSLQPIGPEGGNFIF